MPALTLVRHGQTRGFLRGPYRDLTDLGRQQAHATGRWLATGPRPSTVWVGPQPRHAQTWSALSAAAGWSDEAEVVPALDEHQAARVLGAAVAAGAAPELTSVLVAAWAGERPATDALRAFRDLARGWATGELDLPTPPEAEPWPACRERATGLLSRASSAAGPVLAVTSGGLIGAVVAAAHGASDAVAAELGFVVRNTSLTQIRAGARPLVVAFNETGHLDPAAVTAV